MSRNGLWIVLGALLIGATLSAGSRAAAQTCHSITFRELDKAPFRADLGLSTADYGSGDEDGGGNYQGLYGSFRYASRWVGAALLLPSYRLANPQGDSYGLGDMVLALRATALALRQDELTMGVELPLMLPTGNEARGLGMGHVMPMPALWLAYVRAPFSLRLQLGYGWAIGASRELEPHHHGGGGVARHPPVNPMNRSELEHALTLGLGLSRSLSVHLRWFGAVPIDDPGGVVRQVLAGGMTATVEALDLTFELQRPVAGDAFDYKVLLQLGVSF